VALKLIYQMFTKMLTWMVLHVRSDIANEIEILVLRRLRRCPRVDAQRGGNLDRQVSGPLGDRDERAPAATAHTVTDSTVTRPWRTPRRRRGSGSVASTAARPGAAVTISIGWSSPATRSSTAGIGEDTSAGTALFR
jgi:hypothetical protein